MRTIGDLLRRGLPFCWGVWVYYPITGMLVAAETPNGHTSIKDLTFYADSLIDSEIDYFEEVPIPISEVKKDNVCFCDFHSVIMPYGCQCGGK